MYYIVYKTTNLVNGKYYIGCHQTKNLDDGYLGSGKLLKLAVEKYGFSSFKREVIFEASSKEEMFAKEREYVDHKDPNSYNLKAGGDGGFSHLNNGSFEHRQRSKRARELTNQKLEEKYGSNWNSVIGTLGATARNLKHGPPKGNPKAFLGRKHSEQTKQILSEKAKQRPSNSLGKMWITNGIQNAKISRNEPIPTGWTKGKIQK